MPTQIGSPPALHLALVAPEIPWNTGNIGRSCLAMDAHLHLVRPLGFSLDARHLRRAGLDYWHHVAPSIWPHWRAFEATMPDLGEPWFFSAEGGHQLSEVDFAPPTVLVFGSESAGLPQALREQYRNRLISIPMRPGPVRSLNLSTAAAVAMYEVRRQWSELDATREASVPQQ
jgi:tRNA (cytidine/uridine-2'-O-)-methyltransferase